MNFNARVTAGSGRVVEGIEIVVLAVSVFGSLTVQSRQGARKNRQLLARIVADHTNFAADDRARRIQRQFGRLDEFEFRRIVAVDAEVVDGIAVHRIQPHLLAIEEDRLRGHGSGRHDMPIRQDESALGVDDEARSLRRRVPFGVEGTRAVDLDGDHPAGDSLQGLRPGGGRVHDPRRGHRRRHVSGDRNGGGGGEDAGDGQQQYGQKQCNTGHADPRLDCVQCPWSDKIRNQTVPNKAKLSITAADPMSLAMPARGWRSVPDRSTTASTALLRISTTKISNIGLTSRARSTPELPKYRPAGMTSSASSTSWRNAASSRQVCRNPWKE